MSLRDPQQRLARLVEMAKARPLLPDAMKLDAHLVQGCQVRIWFVPEFRNGRCWFWTDSDAVTLKALVGLLCEIYSGRSPAEIAAHEPKFLEELGVLKQLAESRRATVLRLADQIRAFAEQHRG
jgi:cysteine desulfuration protein SufE